MLKQRVLTALLLAPPILVGLFGLQGLPYALFTACIVLLASWEWTNLAGVITTRARLIGVVVVAVAMMALWWSHSVQQAWPLWVGAIGWLVNLYWVARYPETQSQWASIPGRLMMGVWVLLPCWVGFLQLRDSGAEWLLFVLLLVWCADTGAYFAGRRFGRRKLAPSVSPGKSWEGVFGGMIVTALLALVFISWQRLDVGQGVLLITGTLAVTLVSVLGDLLESMLKRTRGIKDSSALLPGHGGILDRLDSLTAAVPLFALLYPWI
ncbi:phosphatidate cytidylyltransferase [Aidingimonas lacisalsi]|uniref:phosphatidate cytidylyltransferase n=1 Tax=Aidingimonas lacisalsi TaxID=2604086 RepID=UPI0011D1D504|nr:phosphatidate cytidylyltransferase [Aidingimonas lacisalsi]